MAGPEKPFKVGLATRASSQVKDILRQAKDAGRFSKVSAAMKQIDAELESRPLEWGEFLFHTKKPGGVVCVGFARPLTCRYAVFDQERTVLIISIQDMEARE